MRNKIATELCTKPIRETKIKMIEIKEETWIKFTGIIEKRHKNIQI